MKQEQVSVLNSVLKSSKHKSTPKAHYVKVDDVPEELLGF